MLLYLPVLGKFWEIVVGLADSGYGTAFDHKQVMKLRNMDKTIWGRIVAVLGIISLVAAFVAVNTGDVASHLEMVFAGGVLGTIAFFTGIWMMPANKSRL